MNERAECTCAFIEPFTFNLSYSTEDSHAVQVLLGLHDVTIPGYVAGCSALVLDIPHPVRGEAYLLLLDYDNTVNGAVV